MSLVPPRNKYEKISLFGVFFKGGRYLVIQTKKGEWIFPTSLVYWNEQEVQALEDLFMEKLSLTIQVEEELCNFTVIEKGKTFFVKAFRVDSVLVGTIILNTKKIHKWVTLEELLLLPMNARNDGIRKVLEDNSRA